MIDERRRISEHQASRYDDREGLGRAERPGGGEPEDPDTTASQEGPENAATQLSTPHLRESGARLGDSRRRRRLGSGGLLRRLDLSPLLLGPFGLLRGQGLRLDHQVDFLLFRHLLKLPHCLADHPRRSGQRHLSKIF